MFYFLFDLHFLIHLAPLMHHTLAHIFFFFSLLSLDLFVYSWQKGGEYTREYIGVYRHFYMTHVHILRGRNSTSCTFVGGESHMGDAYIPRGRKYLYKKTLFYFVLLYVCFLIVLWCFELYLVSMLCYSHCIVFMCWTCIHPYAIVLYWLHVWIIICFAI